ncbi:hypothetical protein QFC22_005823 [Naganishia vaughanmartiniae]|uniref:Uncharacterized protein n=1 Tax=Naganishia vaughanmartiniae TaxID=1424756 RepID=A0ACC2WRR7_9TREE|nr:hypothetical protein QFC22_005823 [Naganishia vaughanmartiniae]
MPIDWQGEPAGILDLFQHDITLVIADHLAAFDYYGSISALSRTADKFKHILQPYLAQKKEKIWMRLEDWKWDELEEEGMHKYAHIGIMECSIDSKLPINNIAPRYINKSSKKGITTSYANEQQLVQTHCRPWMMIWKGHPHRASITIHERFFPRIEALKFCVDGGAMRVGELHDRGTIKDPTEAVAAVNGLAAFLMERKVETQCSWVFKLEKVPRLVYLRYDGYSGRLPVSFGRISSSVKAVGKAGFKYDREEWSYYGEDEDLAHAEGYYLYQATFHNEEPRQQFTSIKVDMHLNTANISSMLSCAQAGERWTQGANIFSDLTIHLAAHHLSPTQDSRLEFRLFHNHGKPLVYENVPIFAMCVGGSTASAAGGNGKVRVLQRSIDLDFANCRLQSGCKRCIGLGGEVVVID